MKKKKFFIICFSILVGIFLLLIFKFNFSNQQTTQISNPASSYCVQQGHLIEIRDEENGQIGYCISSDGQECEEWSFYYGECSFERYERCVADSCCHADNCVLESEAQNCTNIFCSAECQNGTMDCEAGYCAFVDGNCEVIWNEK